ncbi:MAG TPA: nitroreductase family protein [Novosphingobium sp.]|nr:nitroreductase family protein [Novosphingobium sp.]
MTQSAASTRIADYPIDPDILTRWSPLAFDGTALAEADLASLFEAARWAPSAFNYQPWRFAYALRGDAQWAAFLGALLPFNLPWAEKCGALVFILSDKLVAFPGKAELVPAITGSFDAGAAWAYMALQAHKQGLITHAMAGFDAALASAVTGAGSRYRIETAVAIGRQGDAASLPEGLRAREVPSGRLPISALAFAGALPPCEA